MADYYIQQKSKLLKDFDKMMKRIRKVFVPYFGEKMTENIILESHEEYESLITQLPYVGGKKNYFTDYLVKSAWFLAIFRVLEKHGKSRDEIGEINNQMIEAYLDSYPQILLRILGRWEFTGYNQNKLKKQAENSQKREYLGDWVFTVVDGDGSEFDFGIDYSECGICKFFNEQKAEEFTPFLCQVDFPMSERYGTGLVRTKTIAEGHEKCDFRFKRGRKIGKR